MGQPLEQALRTCLLATALGVRAEVGPGELPVVYYTALLRYLGCTSEAHEMSLLFGDEIAARAAYATIDSSSGRQEFAWLRSHAGAGSGLARRGLPVGAAL